MKFKTLILRFSFLEFDIESLSVFNIWRNPRFSNMQTPKRGGLRGLKNIPVKIQRRCILQVLIPHPIPPSHKRFSVCSRDALCWQSLWSRSPVQPLWTQESLQEVGKRSSPGWKSNPPSDRLYTVSDPTCKQKEFAILFIPLLIPAVLVLTTVRILKQFWKSRLFFFFYNPYIGLINRGWGEY